MICDSHWSRIVLVLCAAASVTAQAQTVLVAGVQYESPSLVAPVAALSVRRGDATEWRMGIAGWTASGAWTRALSPSRALWVGLDVTPINAHSSNKLYVNGVEDPALAYRNSTLQLGGGLRLTPSSRWTTELRGVVLHERVAELPEPMLDVWRSPYVGLDVAQRYDRISAEDVIRSRFEGIRVAARVQGYAGASSWARGTVSVGGGRRVGRLFLRANALAFHGSSLNTVSALLTGGSWDAAGATALYGYSYGAFRVERGVLANAGADLVVSRSTEIGVRGAWLDDSGERHHGSALSVATLWRGMSFGAAVAVPEGDAFRGRWDRALVTGGMTAAILR